MKRLYVAVAACAMAVAGVAAQAAPTLTLDGDVAALVGAVGTTDQQHIGTGSWQANGLSKTSITLTAGTLFGSGANVKVSDIASFSWSTLKSTTGGSTPDWYLTIYTTKDGVNDDGTWYGRRLTFEGLYAKNFSNPANQWNTYQTGAGTNQVTMHDGNRTVAGFYGGPTLNDVTNGAINWGAYATSGTSAVVDYSNETIQSFVLETGSGWAPGFKGYLDDFQVTLDDGKYAQVDFEGSDPAVPEPASVLLGLMGLAPVIGFAKLRRK